MGVISLPVQTVCSFEPEDKLRITGAKWGYPSLIPASILQIFAKSQPAFVNVDCVFISSVVLSVPP